MMGVVRVAADVSVSQVNFMFTPNDITIFVGQSVQWVQTSGFHTVTSGTGALDPMVGSLFDDPLDPSNPSFTHTFTVVGDFPYFCRPHEELDMNGTVHVVLVSDVGQAPAPRPQFTLEQNHPNPFNPSTTIVFTLSIAAPAELSIFDASGARVRRLFRGQAAAKTHRIAWDGTDDTQRRLADGVYFYQLQVAGETRTRKMTLLK